MFKDDLLKDKRILVTGGGTGLGKEMVTHFAKHGAQVYICGRRGNVLEDTANELKEKYGVDVKHEPLDIRSPQDVDDYIGRIFDEGQRSVLPFIYKGIGIFDIYKIIESVVPI